MSLKPMPDSDLDQLPKASHIRNSMALTGSGNKQEQLIDLENTEYTHTQIRQIRLGVQKDVELLRNRIRMLQTEKEKSIRKIAETRKRT